MDRWRITTRKVVVVAIVVTAAAGGDDDVKPTATWIGDWQQKQCLYVLEVVERSPVCRVSYVLHSHVRHCLLWIFLQSWQQFMRQQYKVEELIKQCIMNETQRQSIIKN